MNSVSLLGRLTKDPELRYSNVGNKAVCNFTLAVNRRFKKDEADFISIVAWDKTAEFCSKYFAKGQQVAIVGRIQTRTWDDNDGKRHYVTEVVAEEVHFADSNKGSGEARGKEEPKDGFYPADTDDELPF